MVLQSKETSDIQIVFQWQQSKEWIASDTVYRGI